MALQRARSDIIKVESEELNQPKLEQDALELNQTQMSQANSMREYPIVVHDDDDDPIVIQSTDSSSETD